MRYENEDLISENLSRRAFLQEDEVDAGGGGDDAENERFATDEDKIKKIKNGNTKYFMND